MKIILILASLLASLSAFGQVCPPTSPSELKKMTRDELMDLVEYAIHQKYDPYISNVEKTQCEYERSRAYKVWQANEDREAAKEARKAKAK